MSPKRIKLLQELEQLARAIVKLHDERGVVLTVHVDNMADLLEEMAALGNKHE